MVLWYQCWHVYSSAYICRVDFCQRASVFARHLRDQAESWRVILSQCNIDVILFVCLWYCLCYFLCYRAAVSLKTLSCTLQRNQARQRASEFARDLTHPRCFVQPIFHVCLMHGTHFLELFLKFESDWMSRHWCQWWLNISTSATFNPCRSYHLQ